MKPWTRTEIIRTCALCVLLWIPVAVVCFLTGRNGVSWPHSNIIEFRLTPVLTASLIGGTLAAAGVAYQSILRNPLAEPFLLGVSSGASLAMYLSAISFGAVSAWLAPMGNIAAAFAGAMIAISISLALSQKRGQLEPASLLIIGVIISTACGSLYLLVYHLNLRNDMTYQTGGPFRFLVGSINTNLSHRDILITAIVSLIGWITLYSYAGPLHAASISVEEARSLGVDINRVRWVILIIASVMTAGVTAISGPIGFVGLICPHLARMIVGVDPRKMLPLATALGAMLLSLADALSRLLAPKTSGPLPVGVITGLLGGPFFLLVFYRSRVRR